MVVQRLWRPVAAPPPPTPPAPAAPLLVRFDDVVLWGPPPTNRFESGAVFRRGLGSMPADTPVSRLRAAAAAAFGFPPGVRHTLSLTDSAGYLLQDLEDADYGGGPLRLCDYSSLMAHAALGAPPPGRRGEAWVFVNPHHFRMRRLPPGASPSARARAAAWAEPSRWPDEDGSSC